MLKIILIIVLMFSFGLQPVSAAQKVSSVSVKKQQEKLTVAKKKIVKKIVPVKKVVKTKIPAKTKIVPKNIAPFIQEPLPSSSSSSDVIVPVPTPSIPQKTPQEDTKEKLRKLQESLKEIKKIEPVKLVPIEPSFKYSPEAPIAPQLRADPLLPYYNNLSPF
ncbi:hypothetical protein HY621_01360 [Candidatus Uhrbacteria bacterium]|nr:hypothetical protein [Candidatus Uhrbacteria bacterium]